MPHPYEDQKNIPDFNWITDEETRKYCENNFVNDEILEMLKEDGNILREMEPSKYGVNDKPWMNVYNTNEGIYLEHGPIDQI